MQLNDPTDYPIVIGRTDGLVPAKFKGRGLINVISEEKIYEFQTAYCKECDDQYEFIREYCSNAADNADGFAKRIPVLPEFVRAYDVKDAVSKLVLPVGIEKRDIKPAVINLENQYIYPIIATDSFILEPFVDEFAKTFELLKNCKIQILDCEGWCKEKLHNTTVISSDYKEPIEEIFEDVVARHNGYKAANMDSSYLNKFEERIRMEELRI